MNKYLAQVALITFSLLALVACNKSANHTSVKGKVLHIPLEDNIKTADPTNLYDVVGAEVVYQIYETPYQYNYFSEKVEVIPLLAEAMPTISKDGLTLSFKIKKGVRFQDDPCFKATNGKGRELKAQDFVYAYKRHANPKNESQGFWIFDNKVVGMNEFQKKFGSKADEEVMQEPVEGVKALDDYTVQLKFTNPYRQMLYILTMSFMAPIPNEAVEYYRKDLVNHPVGTGPFKVSLYEPTSKVILVKNENFREEFFPAAEKIAKKFQNYTAYSGKKIPLVDAIEFDVVKEEQPRWLQFLAGKYDEIKIPKDNFGSAIKSGLEVTDELKAKGIWVSVEPAYAFWYVAMNFKDKVLGTNKYLRQALASLVNQAEWLKIFKNNRGDLQTEVNPPSVVDRCGKPYRWTYNENRARELLKKAGFANGEGLPVFSYDTRGTSATERQLAEFMQKNFAKIGIKVDIVANTFPAYLEKQNRGNLQIAKGGWVLDYPDAENGYQLMYGPNKAPGPNEANFENAEFDKIYLKMAQMPSGKERAKLVCQLEDIIQEQAPWGYGIYENEYRLVQKRLINFHTAELIYNKWKYVDTQ